MLRSLPFFLFHLLPLGALFTGVRWQDVALGVAMYGALMFFITAGYHRYFSHRTYAMGRAMQFLMAFGGAAAVQKGPLWWAAHHRDHHRYSDTVDDPHTPKRGFWRSHVGWILGRRYADTNLARVRDLARFPELRWLNRFYLVPPLVVAALVFALGGASALLIGYVLPVVLVWHATFLVNSLAHVMGRRRYATRDTSRNSLLIALLTLGEGWHNNHHHYPASVRQGFFWWEIDVSYQILRALAAVRLVRDLRTPPERVLAADRVADGTFDVGLFEAYRARAARAVSRVRSQTNEVYDAQRQALEDLLERTRETADQLSRAATGPQRAP